MVANSRSTSSSHRAGRDRCGTPSGSGDLGATRAVTQGTLTVTLEVYACEHYDGEFTQNVVHVEGAGAVLRAVHLDFGDGTATDVAVYRWAFDDPKRPNPYHANGPFHTYTAVGAYTVNATVTTAACSPPGDGPADVETTTVTPTTYQIAGSRPRPPHWSDLDPERAVPVASLLRAARFRGAAAVFAISVTLAAAFPTVLTVALLVRLVAAGAFVPACAAVFAPGLAPAGERPLCDAVLVSASLVDLLGTLFERAVSPPCRHCWVGAVCMGPRDL